MESLNALVDTFGDDLFIMGVPANNFAMQEPGANNVLLSGYKHIRPGNGFEPKYSISAKCDVNGAAEHELYTFLKGVCPPTLATIGDKEQMFWSPISVSDITWNFEKFLIGTDGRPVRRYAPAVFPEAIVEDIREQINIGKQRSKMEEAKPKQNKTKVAKPSLTDIIGDSPQEN